MTRLSTFLLPLLLLLAAPEAAARKPGEPPPGWRLYVGATVDPVLEPAPAVPAATILGMVLRPSGTSRWALHAGRELPRNRAPTGHPDGQVGARYTHGPWQARLTLRTSSDEAMAHVASRATRPRFELTIARGF